jgi:hypothetical protein
VVNPTEGTYDGCYESRTYEVEILLPNQPKEVLVDNKKISDWEYKNGKVYLTVSQPDVRERIVVSIK